MIQVGSAPLHTAHDILGPVSHVLCVRVLLAGQQNKETVKRWRNNRPDCPLRAVVT